MIFSMVMFSIWIFEPMEGEQLHTHFQLFSFNWFIFFHQLAPLQVCVCFCLTSIWILPQPVSSTLEWVLNTILGPIYSSGYHRVMFHCWNSSRPPNATEEPDVCVSEWQSSNSADLFFNNCRACFVSVLHTRYFAFVSSLVNTSKCARVVEMWTFRDKYSQRCDSV